MKMITNDDPVMARAMLCVQGACAVAVDRLIRKGLEDMGHDRSWVVFRIGLSSVYGDTNLRVEVTGPFDNEKTAHERASRLQGQTFVLGPVETR